MWRLTCLWNRWKYCAGVSYLWHRTYLQSRWKYWAKMGYLWHRTCLWRRWKYWEGMSYLWHRTCLRRRWKYWAGVVGLATSMLTLSPSTFTSLLSHIYNKNTRNHNTGYTNCHKCVFNWTDLTLAATQNLDIKNSDTFYLCWGEVSTVYQRKH